MSFHRFYNNYPNVNRPPQQHTNDELYSLVVNTNNIINIQSQVITNLNSNVVNLTRMVYNLENQLVNIQSTIDNNRLSSNVSVNQANLRNNTSFNRIPGSNINTIPPPLNINTIPPPTFNTTAPSNSNITTPESNINTIPPSNLNIATPSNLRNNITSRTTGLLDNILDDIILNSPIPRRSVRPRRYPEIMEVTYSVDNNPPRSLVDLFRTINEEQTPDNVITTHETITRNTEVYTYSRDDVEVGSNDVEVGSNDVEVGSNDDDVGSNDDDVGSNDVEVGSNDVEVGSNDVEVGSNDDQDRDRCVICQEPFEDGCIMRKIKKCNHSFHMNCLDTWLERKITCPTCRCDIREHTNTTNEDDQTRDI